MSFMIGCSNTSDTPKARIATFSKKYQLTREDTHKDAIEKGSSLTFKIGIPIVNKQSSMSEERLGTITINSEYYKDYIQFYARSKNNPKGGNFYKVRVDRKAEVEMPLTDTFQVIETGGTGGFTLTFKRMLSEKPYIVCHFPYGISELISSSGNGIWFAPDIVDTTPSINDDELDMF